MKIAKGKSVAGGTKVLSPTKSDPETHFSAKVLKIKYKNLLGTIRTTRRAECGG